MIDNSKEILSKVKILYVEDEENVRDSIIETFSFFCKKIIPAANGQEGLDLYRQHGDFDVIVTDINMPVMDGLTMIKEIRKDDPLIPITITTAHTQVEFFQESVKLNVTGYTLKPLNLKELALTIAQAVESRMLRKELEDINNNLIVQLKETTNELHSILNAQENLVLVVSNNTIHTINKAFLEFVAKKDVEEFNTDIEEIYQLFNIDEKYGFVNDFYQFAIAHEQTQDIIIEIENWNNLKEIFKLNITSYTTTAKHYVLTFTNITTIQEQKRLLEHRATHDVLTQLANRQKLNETLDIEMHRSSRYQHNLSIGMLDIDFFKKINDTYGHDVGDEVLVNLSSFMVKTLRKTDLVARWGGEEFMILFPETTLEDAYTTIEKLRIAIEQTQLSTKIDRPITCSFGVTFYDIKNDNINSLLKRVDDALYKAKETGRNKVIKL